MKKLLSLVLVLALSAALLVGCAAPSQTAAAPQVQAEAPAEPVSAGKPAEEPRRTGGVLCVKINPEIALHYDENGKVTKLEGRNAEGIQILKGFDGFEGKDTAQVLEELVDIIGKAGYFVEEADGNARRIVLELDPGSQVPHEQFLQDMAAHVKSCVESKNWVGEREFEYPEKVPQTSATEPAAPKATTPAVTLCPICGDDDCDDGKYCDDADELAENLREAENRKKGITCPVCGDYDCDDGKFCDDWDDRYDDHHDDDHHDD